MEGEGFASPAVGLRWSAEGAAATAVVKPGHRSASCSGSYAYRRLSPRSRIEPGAPGG